MSLSNSELLVVLKDITASRYTTGAAFALFLCDTIQHLRQDIELVLPSSSKAFSLAYFLNRFIALLALLGVSHALSGFSGTLSDNLWARSELGSKPHLTHYRCKALLGSDLSLGVVSISLTDALATVEVWRLWDMNVIAGRILLVAFLATNTAGLVCMIVLDVVHLRHARFERTLKSCIIHPVPKTLIAAVYGSGLLFEAAVFISTLINVLHKPRNSHTPLATILYRDGCLFFVAVFALRLTNTVVTVLSRESTNYLVNHLVWVLVLIMVNRLVRNQCKGRKWYEHRVLNSNDVGFGSPSLGVNVAREIDVELDTLCIDAM